MRRRRVARTLTRPCPCLAVRQRALADAGLLQVEGAGMRVATFCKNPVLAQSIALDIHCDFIGQDSA